MLSKEQRKILLDLLKKQDIFANIPITADYIVKDSDGEVRVFSGDKPIRNENGFWGGENSIPLTELDSCYFQDIEKDHLLPFSIIESLVNEKWTFANIKKDIQFNETLTYLNKEDIQHLRIYLNRLPITERIVIASNHLQEDKWLFSNSLSFNSESLVQALRVRPSVIVLDYKEDCLKEVNRLSEQGYTVIVIK